MRVLPTRRLVKKITAENGELYIRIRGKNVLLSKCSPVIEIWETSKELTAANGSKFKVYMASYSIVLCRDMEFTTEVGFELLEKIDSFDIEFDLLETDASLTRKRIENIIPEEIDLLGDWRFRLTEKEAELADLSRYIRSTHG